MNRRMFIAAASTSTVTALAGCSDLNIGGGGRERAEQHYASAQDKLLKNDEDIEAVASADSVPDDFDPETRNKRLDEIYTALDTAEEHAPEDMMSDIKNLRTVADFQSQVTAYTKTLVDLEECWRNIDGNFDEESWKDTYSHLEECRPLLSDLNTQYDEMTTTFEEIDQDRLDETTDLDYSDRSAKIPMDDEELSVRLSIIDGLDDFIAGMTHFLEGGDHVSAEEFEAAEEKFRTAESKFESSASTFEEIRSNHDLSDKMDGQLDQLHCVASHATTGSSYFAEGAAAAQEGNYNAAQEYFTAGEEHFAQDCHNTGDSSATHE